MASAVYKEYLIVSSARLLEPTPSVRTWCANVLISWQTGVLRRNFHQLKPEQRFDLALDAEQFGLTLAKAWIDGQM